MVESNYEETEEDWIVQSLVINWSRTSDVSYSEVYPSSLLYIQLINPNYIDVQTGAWNVNKSQLALAILMSLFIIFKHVK